MHWDTRVFLIKSFIMITETLNKLLSSEILFIDSYKELRDKESNSNSVDGAIIGTGRSDFTQESTMYNLNIDDKAFALLDIPGIEGDESKFEQIIKDSLDKAHTIFYVNGSSKKIEKETLKKIKKYMHDGTSVYAIFNVHCKAKKDRIEGIDKTYTEELSEAYKNQNEIIEQTEKELISILGDNYKGSFSLNGLLAFCACSINKEGYTTILNEENKNLRNDQKKFVKEYSGNLVLMKNDSHIDKISDVITEKVKNYNEYIYEENIKKLRNRLSEVTSKIEGIRKSEIQKIRGFYRIYDDFESNCYNAKEDFISEVNHISHNAVDNEFEKIKSELFERIEKDKGKTNASEIEAYFDSQKKEITKNIQNNVNKRFEEAQKSYEDAIKDAQDRLMKDFERENTKFSVLLSGDGLCLDISFLNAFKYSAKDFGKHLFNTASLAFSGAGVGSFICPGLGTAIGAGIGVILGFISSIFNFLILEAKRINKAKEKLGRTLDDQAYEISEQLKNEIMKLNIEEKINKDYNKIVDTITVQKNNLRNVELLLSDVSKELNKKKELIK